MVDFFWCFGRKLKKTEKTQTRNKNSANPPRALSDNQCQKFAKKCKEFTYNELAEATNNFGRDNVIGQGGFGAVYKGKLKSTRQDVAVKVLDAGSVQGDKEFIVEVLMLSVVRHENMVKLIGYCAKDDHRIVVYEYMPLGCLEDRIQGHRRGYKTLDWSTRMNIALGTARALEHLHHKQEPQVIYRDLKTTNILLDHNFTPKLSDFGLAKFGPTGDETHVSTRIMGTHGYCDPAYAFTGRLTTKSDVYSFGIVMLELITGKKAVLDSYDGSKLFLVNWAMPLYKSKGRLLEIVDPVLFNEYVLLELTLTSALKVAFDCLGEDAMKRPSIGVVVDALDFIVKELAKKTRANVGSSSSTASEVRRDSVAEAKSWALRRRNRKPPSPTL